MRFVLAVLFALVFAATAHARPLPDLVLLEPDPAVDPPAVVEKTFDPNYIYDRCPVQEGAIADYGTYKLLRFTTTLANIGRADLKIGDPATYTGGGFEWQPCHAHYHFKDYANYELLDSTGNVAGLGHKQGFCFIDTWPYTAGIRSRPQFTNCDDDQGLSRGWSDVYDSSLTGQWIVVGTRQADGTWNQLPAGQYTLRVTINPANVLPESSYSNNTRSVVVTIP